MTSSSPHQPPASGVVLPPDHPAFPAAGARVVHLGGSVWLEADREVTPQLAEAFLEYNPINRNLVNRVVQRYARDMAEGRWRLTGDAFRFADTGRLLDGQHRAWAVVESGVTLHVPIITGLPETAQDNMDVGRKRTVGDQIKLAGYAHYNAIGTAARILWLWDRDALLSTQPSPSNPEILEYVEKLSSEGLTLEEAATATLGFRKLMRSHSVLTACYHRAMTVDPAAATEFFAKLRTGANLSTTSPILALRETLLKRVATPGRQMLTPEAVYYIARAWMLWRKGQQTTKIILPKGGLTMRNIPKIV